MENTDKINTLVAILKELIRDSASSEHHPDVCSRTSECDDATESGEECSYCYDSSCPDCECGIAITQEIVQRAMDLVKEMEGNEKDQNQEE